MVLETHGRFALARCRNGCCQPVYIPGPRETLRISASVGRGGVNRPADVRRIQEALNEVPVGAGGTLPRLVVDGLAGPKTQKAIYNFQVHHFGAAKADSRIDPEQYTLAKLREVLKPSAATPALPSAPPSATGVALRLHAAPPGPAAPPAAAGMARVRRCHPLAKRWIGAAEIVLANALIAVANGAASGSLEE